MTLPELKQLTETMGLINRLVQNKELPADKGAEAVVAIGDLLGFQNYHESQHAAVDAT